MPSVVKCACAHDCCPISETRQHNNTIRAELFKTSPLFVKELVCYSASLIGFECQNVRDICAICLLCTVSHKMTAKWVNYLLAQTKIYVMINNLRQARIRVCWWQSFKKRWWQLRESHRREQLLQGMTSTVDLKFTCSRMLAFYPTARTKPTMFSLLLNRSMQFKRAVYAHYSCV